jgi:hypothetical protein
VSINIISIIIIISAHHLFCKDPRPLVTVSTAVITVLHSTEVVHFHCESWFTLSPEVANLLTHFQGRSAGFTMKSFKGSSNKLGPLYSLDNTDVEPPFHMAQWRVTYTHKDRGRTIPNSSSHSYAKKVTTNKLEKDQVRLTDISLPKFDVMLDQVPICTGQLQGRVEGSTRSYWMREHVPHHKTSSTCQHVLPSTMPLRD